MRHYNIVNQRSNNDCAVACLSMILRHYNIKVDYEKLKDDLDTKEDGTSIYNIVKISKKYGLNAVGYKKIKIDNIKVPAIALVINGDISHFVVIYKIMKNSVLVADPTSKVMRISKDFFEKYFTGIVIRFIKKTPNKKFSFIIVFYFIINILIIFLNFLLLFIIYKIIYILETNTYFLNYKYILVFLLFYTLKSLLLYINNLVTVKMKIIIDRKITLPFISKLLSPNNIIKSDVVNNLIGKYHDLNYIKELYFKCISIYIINFLFLIISFSLLFFINYKISFILFIYIIINLIFNYKYYSINYFKILDNQITKEKYFFAITDIANNNNKIKKINYNKVRKEYNSYVLKYKELENKIVLKNFVCDLFYLFFIIVIILYIYITKIKFSNAFYTYSLIMVILDIVDSFICDFPSIMNYKAVKERLKK